MVVLEAVCDLSPALAELTRNRHGAGGAYTDVDEMLDSVRPDVVHVLTPPRTHPELVRRSLAAGAHVICEKPLAPTAEQTESLLSAARSANRLVLETRNLLFNDVVQKLDEQLLKGQVGELREIDVSLALDLGNHDVPEGGTGLPLGLAHDYLPHLAYLFLHFAGESADTDEVIGHVDNLSGKRPVGFDHLDVLITHGLTRGRLRVSPDVAPSCLRLGLRGTAGSLEADLYQPYLLHEGPPFTGKKAPIGLVAEGIGLIAAGGRNVRDRLLQHGTYHGMPRMLDAIYEALVTGRTPPVSERDMIASARLIDRIAELAEGSR